MPQNAPTLDYNEAGTYAYGRRSIVWLFLAVPVLVIPFVNFSCKESPVEVLWEAATQTSPSNFSAAKEVFSLCTLAANICLGTVAFAWRVRERWPTTQVERIIAVSLGVTGELALLALLAMLTPEASKWQEWMSLGAWCATLVATLWLTWVMYRRRRRNAMALGALLAPFIAGGAFALFEFYDDRELGWYLALVSIPLSFVEMISLAYAGERRQKETTGAKPAVALTVN